MAALTRRKFLARSGQALAGLGLLQSPWATAVAPFKSLQIVVPAPAGTQPDLLARWLIEPLAQRAGVPGVVHNRPGAAGAIAVDAVLAAPADSGPLFLGGLDHVAYSHVLNNRRALDPLEDLLPVGAVNRDSWVLVRTADPGLRKFSTLNDLAFRRPAITYASTGEGTTAHLLMARLCQALQVDARHIPYKDSYLLDVVAGRVDAVLAPVPSVMSLLKAGRVEAVVSLTDERMALLEAVPSVREAGWPEQVFHGGLFLFAPPALGPQAALFNQWLREALQEPRIQALYRAAAIEPTPLALEEVRKSVQARLRTVDAMRQAVFGRAR